MAHNNSIKIAKLYKLSKVLRLVSIFFMIICFMYLSYEGLPYQDPTPEMLVEQMKNIKFYGDIFKVSILVTLCLSIFSFICKRKMN